MVEMDKSFTLCEPKIECETGALRKEKKKKKRQDSATRDFTKWTWWLGD